MLSPMLTLFLSLVAWAVIPFQDKLVLAYVTVGILYLFASSSLAVLRHHHGRLVVEFEIRLLGRPA